MTSSKKSDGQSPSSPAQFVHYQSLPSEPQQPQYIIVLPPYPRPRPIFDRSCRNFLLCVSVIVLLAVAVFFLWPSGPDVSVARLKLQGFKIHLIPLSIDITLDLSVKVRNPNFYSIDYTSLVVWIGYRGKQLGNVTSDKGHLQARASSYINATLELEGVEIFSDVLSIIEDVSKGSITFDTVTLINGQLDLYFFHLPLEGKVSCEIVVDTNNQTISSQDCYPEVKCLF
nr:transmembrane protein 106C [Ipomoea batatas]